VPRFILPLFPMVAALGLIGCLVPESRVVDSPMPARDRPPTCFSICNQRLTSLCEDIDPTGCERECLSNWRAETLACMQGASSCEQITQDPPYCRPRLDADLAPAAPAPPPPSTECQRACRNYRTCAGYADDATEADRTAAYDTCLDVCGDWPTLERDCIADVTVQRPADCARVSACGLRAMRSVVPLP
jgi:hypothetical protein